MAANMAASKPVYSTGSTNNEQDLRRRNVPVQAGANGAVARSPEETKLKTKRKNSSVMETLDEYEPLYAPIMFTFLAFFTRMYKIGLSNIVTWDEAQYVVLSLTRAMANVHFLQLREVRVSLSQTRILLRRPPAAGEDAGWSFRLPCRL